MKMSILTKAILISPAIITGVAVSGYITYQCIQSKRKKKKADSSSSSEDYCSALEHLSDDEYFDTEVESTSGAEKDQLYERLDKLMQGDESRIEAAYLEMTNCLDNLAECPNFLWRYAKVHHLMGKLKGSRARSLNGEGLEYAKKAVTKDPKNPEAHKWFAILTGREAEFLKDRTKKVEKAKTFFKHIQIALDLRSKDWELYHLLGIFEYELASLHSFTKLFAKRIFKGISRCEFGDAKKYFKTAENLNPESSKETKLFLAKCLCREEKFEEALECVISACDMEVKSIVDKACHKELEELKLDLLDKVKPFS